MIYNTIISSLSFKVFLAALLFSKSENIGIIDASVFPEPVGATKRQFFIRAITGIEIFCIFVKFWNPSFWKDSTICFSITFIQLRDFSMSESCLALTLIFSYNIVVKSPTMNKPTAIPTKISKFIDNYPKHTFLIYKPIEIWYKLEAWFGCSFCMTPNQKYHIFASLNADSFSSSSRHGFRE